MSTVPTNEEKRLFAKAFDTVSSESTNIPAKVEERHREAARKLILGLKAYAESERGRHFECDTEAVAQALANAEAEALERGADVNQDRTTELELRALAVKILEIAQMEEESDEGAIVQMPDEDEWGELVGIARTIAKTSEEAP
jgi:hypothetical protein